MHHLWWVVICLIFLLSNNLNIWGSTHPLNSAIVINADHFSFNDKIMVISCDNFVYQRFLPKISLLVRTATFGFMVKCFWLPILFFFKGSHALTQRSWVRSLNWNTSYAISHWYNAIKQIFFFPKTLKSTLMWAFLQTRSLYVFSLVSLMGNIYLFINLVTCHLTTRMTYLMVASMAVSTASNASIESQIFKKRWNLLWIEHGLEVYLRRQRRTGLAS